MMRASLIVSRANVATVARTVAGSFRDKPKPILIASKANVGQVTPAVAGPLPVDLEPLQVSMKGDLRKLAGAVAGRLREDGTCVLDALGPESIYQALTSLIIAEGNLGNDQRLVTMPESRMLPDMRRPGQQLSMMRLHVKLMPPASSVAGTRLLVASETTGNVGRAIAAMIRKKDFPSICGTAAKSVDVAVRAIIAAQTSLDQDEVTDDRRLAFTLHKEVVFDDRFRRHLVGMALTCIRATWPLEMWAVSDP
eukprot:CAMPEP_0194532602 /NCGR_PEP_ID=MMETSP0253-20130528/70218_1 /TAXON_ID=2966 /ORGANISM="Noctiluca scintillans" /LENGTH=251 /DNA_ID=CAMNT_0039378071 /DNA_START=63 /DNA_END=815 /DNA_ORIENTATION=-